MKKRPGYTSIFASAGTGRPVYVVNDLADQFKEIIRQYRSSYHFTTVFRQLTLLNADAAQGKGLNRANDIREIKSGGVTLEYSIYDGSVLINYLKIVNSNQSAKSGLYQVTYKKDIRAWSVHGEPVSSFDTTKLWKSGKGNAHYAAIPGEFSDEKDASRNIAAHVIGAYKKADLMTSHDTGDQFSMYWMEKGTHKSKEPAQSIASLMQQSSKNKLNVNWLVHAQGTDTFKNAAKILKSSPLATAEQQAKNLNAGKIETTQNVYFSNPNTSNVKELEKLCQEAGLNYVDVNTSNRDLRRLGTLKNAGMDVGKIMAVAVAGGAALNPGVALKTLGAGGADKVVMNGIDAAMSGNFLQLGAALAATGFIALGVSKKMQKIRAGAHCTFGKGNQKWYSGDDSLFV